MVRRFLITTALEETWPEDSEMPVLFLGEWCRIYSRKERWSKMNAEVLPYHWDDRNKLYNDYRYLNIIYENTLKALQNQLNEIHQVDNSLRYWRILIGLWLGFFIQTVYDRWSMLKHAFEKHEISGCCVLGKDENTFIPNDMNSFLSYFIDDNWNEAIYSQLLKEHWQDNIIIELVREKNDQPQQSNQANRTFKSLPRRFKRLVFNEYFKYKYWLDDSNKYFFLNTYLRLSMEEKLLMRLGQNPNNFKLAWTTPQTEVDNNMREWIVDGNDSFDQFSTITNRMIPKHIPTAYLEGYQSLLDCVQNLLWPKRPKCIFTSNAYSSDDVFKAWAAGKTEIGVPFVIGQHGGNHGMTPWAFHEKHQIEIADAWLSWGWSNKKDKKVIPGCNFNVLGIRKLDYDPDGSALLVEGAIPRYSYHMYAAPVAGQWLSYFDDQCQFIYSLPEYLRKQVIVRLYVHDYKWCQKERWMNHFPEIQLESGKQPILNLVGKSRLYIATYNATTYLESLAWNMPTIIFWNPKHWELRDDAIPYFELLISAGIFHETPESASKQMVDIWDDIPAWWESEAVQNIRRQFCDRYSCIPEKPLDKLENFFREISVEI